MVVATLTSYTPAVPEFVFVVNDASSVGTKITLSSILVTLKIEVLPLLVEPTDKLSVAF
ncbi:MAG: hypothetical protein IJP63_09190 [Acholeplasmatales bacterium]|nr:hypothetical protein [Acholeplasmatales bacterium]